MDPHQDVQVSSHRARVLPDPRPRTVRTPPENSPAAGFKIWVDTVDRLTRHLRQVDRVVRSKNSGCGWRVFGARLDRAGGGLGKDPRRLRPRPRRSGADEDAAAKGVAMPVTP